MLNEPSEYYKDLKNVQSADVFPEYVIYYR